MLLHLAAPNAARGLSQCGELLCCCGVDAHSLVQLSFGDASLHGSCKTLQQGLRPQSTHMQQQSGSRQAAPCMAPVMLSSKSGHAAMSLVPWWRLSTTAVIVKMQQYCVTVSLRKDMQHHSLHFSDGSRCCTVCTPAHAPHDRLQRLHPDGTHAFRTQKACSRQGPPAEFGSTWLARWSACCQ